MTSRARILLGCRLLASVALLGGCGEPCELVLMTDVDGDGQIDGTRTWTYDATGKLVLRTSGEFTEELSYDGDDKLIRKEIYRGRVLNRLILFAYDEQGRKVRETIDYRADGDVDDVVSWEYDGDGHAVRRVTSDGVDSDPESITTFAYDSNGNVIREEFDHDADGIPFYVNGCEFDDAGNQVGFWQAGGDGPNDVNDGPWIVEEWVYDGEGNKLRYERNANAVVFDSVVTWTYDEEGKKLSSARDGGSYSEPDGEPDALTVWSYDAHGNRVREEVDEGLDGQPESITVWSYDANGRQVREEVDWDANGEPDHVTTRVYECRVPPAWPDPSSDVRLGCEGRVKY